MNPPDDVIINEQLKYTPSNDTLRTAQQIAYARMDKLTDEQFAHVTAGLKLAYDLLDKLVYEDGLNELAGALAVITMLGSVNNSRWYGLLADKDNPIAGVLSNMVYGGRHGKK